MSKLPQENKFLDFSDYGRPIAKRIAKLLQKTPLTAIHVTLAFVVSGIAAIYCMLIGSYYLAAFFLILKSILDAADGELARLKNQPSYVGRFLDSISDIILNFFFLLTIRHITEASYSWMFVAFLGLQLQGTLYNYYYVILRNRFNGDTTSRIFEKGIPKALVGEKQKTVSILFYIYKFLYGIFDKSIYLLDTKASENGIFPNWFMSILSIFGLGFQLLLMAIFLVINKVEFILPTFALLSFGILIMIGIRKLISCNPKVSFEVN